jgi:hypothetical protein
MSWLESAAGGTLRITNEVAGQRVAGKHLNTIIERICLMSVSKRFTYFCGIDIAKDKHVVCVIDRDGSQCIRPSSFANTAEGYQRLIDRLKDTAKASSVLIGMEATGHYWYSLHDFLTRCGYTVVVLNPIQTARQVAQAIRKCKTDKYDAVHIAALIRCGDYKPAAIPGELAMTCRQLTRLRYSMIGQYTRIKQLLWSRLHPVWPEYEPLFANPFNKTGRTLLRIAPTPQDMLKIDCDDLSEMVRSTSRGKLGHLKAQLGRRHKNQSECIAGVKVSVLQSTACWIKWKHGT